MKTKTFKPMLAPNELASFKPTDDPKKFYVGDLNFPLLGSHKLDGIRCEFKQGEILSRSLKQIQNTQLRQKFEEIRAWTAETGNILDGEFYNHNVPFGFISSCVMTQNYNDKKSIKSWEELQEKHDFYITRKEAFDGIQFHCFDILQGGDNDYPFNERIKMVKEVSELFEDCILVEHELFHSKQEVEDFFEEALEEGYEGLILRNPMGHYKFGRGTIKEGLIYKIKPYEPFDAKIIGIVQSTEVDPNAEKKTNELGRSVTSKKKEDRILIEKASAFIVEYEGKEVKPTLSMTDAEKKEVWANRTSYIGKMIEYKGMLVGSVETPRHPTFVRFREDKDGN